MNGIKMQHKNNSKVTIITVTYNAQEYLERTIQSVIEQDYNNIEYIIIDGASSDNTINIIKQYEQYISYWISEPDTGVYDAMNKGIDIASGEWINFMNAGDSFASQDAISYLISNLEENIDLITGDRYSVYENSSKKVLNKALGMQGIKEFGMPSGHQSMLIKSSLMKEYKYSLLYKYASDHDLMLRFYRDNKKIKLVDRAISNYLRGGYSDENNMEAYLEVLFLMIKYKPYETDLNKLNLFKNFFYAYQPQEVKEENNLLFSIQLNKIIEQFYLYIENNQNILLYGNGQVTQMLLNIQSKNIIGIIDQNNLTNNDLEIPVGRPELIKSIQYDKILITVLGREESIIEYLKTSFDVKIDNILTFNIRRIY